MLSDKYLYALWEEKQYPTPDKLQTLYRIALTDKYNAATVFRAFDAILSIAPRIEDILNTGEVLIDETKTNLVPINIISRLSGKVAIAFADSLAICALRNALTGENYPIGVASELCEVDAGVDLKGMFHLVAHEPVSLKTLPTPVNLSIKCPLVIAEEDVLEVLEFASVCHNLECAIAWSWVRIVPRQNRAKLRLGEFKIRKEFEQSLNQLGLMIDVVEQVCRKVATLLCGLHPPGLEIEPLRVDRGPNSPQICRSGDGAKAYRMQISQYGPGYHVHYWRSASGPMSEIAWIETHDDFYIPE